MGHWYTKEGEPMHWLTGANGKERATTLRDAKKLDLLPSVTTILGLLNKPGLNNWYQKQYIMAALTLPRKENESIDDFAKRIPRDAMQQADDARDIGGEIHAAIEEVFNGCYPTNNDPNINDIALRSVEAIKEYTGCDVMDFHAEKTVSGNGYGGMIDLHNEDFVIDWKTKDIADVNAKLAWPEMAMQLAAYDMALETKFIVDPRVRKPRRCINVFVDRTEPGKVVIHEWEPEEIETAWEKFSLLVRFWQLDKGV